jgi:hypothetical protein
MAELPDQMPAAGRGHLRASHADREQVIGTLKAAFVQGRLTKLEFDLRVGQVLTSQTCGDLAALTADLPAGLAIAQPPKPAPAQGEPRIPRPGRVLTGATVLCAAAWGVAFALPTSGPEHESPVGMAMVFGSTFAYLLLLLMTGTPILADWLNKHW